MPVRIRLAAGCKPTIHGLRVALKATGLSLSGGFVHTGAGCEQQVAGKRVGGPFRAVVQKKRSSRGTPQVGGKLRVLSRQLLINAGLAAFTDRVLMSKLLTILPEVPELSLPPLVKTLKIVGFWNRL